MAKQMLCPALSGPRPLLSPAARDARPRPRIGAARRGTPAPALPQINGALFNAERPIARRQFVPPRCSDHVTLFSRSKSVSRVSPSISSILQQLSRDLLKFQLLSITPLVHLLIYVSCSILFTSLVFMLGSLFVQHRVFHLSQFLVQSRVHPVCYCLFAFSVQ